MQSILELDLKASLILAASLKGSAIFDD